MLCSLFLIDGPGAESMTDLCNKVAIDTDAGTAIVVEAATIAALLVGIQVDSPRLAGHIADQFQALVKLPQLHNTNSHSLSR